MASIWPTAKTRSKRTAPLVVEIWQLTYRSSVWIPEWVSNKSGEAWSVRLWDELADELEKIAPGSVKKALGGNI